MHEFVVYMVAHTSSIISAAIQQFVTEKPQHVRKYKCEIIMHRSAHTHTHTDTHSHKHS